MSKNDLHTPQSPLSTGIRGRCPRCGQGKMFTGYLNVTPRCEACGLDFSFADSGDGPAVFVILIAGFIVLGFALWVEFTFTPPFWVHLLTSLPVLLIVCGGLLRMFKGMLISQQYMKNASEGRLDS